MSVIDCLCSDDIDGVDNFKCNSETYGTQIVALLYQKPGGTEFDGTSGNDITVSADWQTRLTATGEDKIAAIPYISSATLPAPEDTLAEDNDVAYGGQELEDRKQMITFDLRYLSSTIFDQLDTITNCTGLVDVWFLDNLGWIWGATSTGGALQNVSLLMKTPALEDITSKTKVVGNTATWHSPCTHRPIAQVTFLQGLIDDLAPSGS